MASSDSPDQHALNALRSPGFHVVKDAEVGKHAAEPFEDIDTEAGLRFFMQNFQNDKRISAILKSILGPYQLAAYRTFTPDTTRIFQFRKGGEEAGCILVVLLWPPDSKCIYYGNSLQHHLFAVDSDNGLWRVPQAAANLAGCGQGEPIELEHGGFAIQDGRTLVTFTAGKPIAATFASDKFLEKWRWKRRPLSTTEEMKQNLKACEKEDFRFFVQYIANPIPQVDVHQ